MRDIKQLIQTLDERLTHLGNTLEQKQMRFYPSLVGPCFFLIFGVVGFLLMPSQVKIEQDMVTSARTFPTLLLGLILGSATILLIKEVLKILKKQPVEVVVLNLLTEVKALVIFVLLVCYALLIPVLGFIVSSILFGISMLAYFRIKKWQYYLIVALLAILIGLLFKEVLNVRLP